MEKTGLLIVAEKTDDRLKERETHNAFGSFRRRPEVLVVADLLSGKKPAIDLAGLTIERYGQAA